LTSESDATPGLGGQVLAEPEPADDSASSFEAPDSARPVKRAGAAVSSGGRSWAALGILGALALYLLAACLLYWPVAPWSNSQVVSRATTDPVQTVWYLQWVAFAVAHGVNPFFSKYLDVPHGANIASNTSVPLLGVLGAPITWLWGAITTFNLMMRFGLALSAFTMFLVLRQWTKWWPAAFIGGLLNGFNSFNIQESNQHLHLVWLVFPPLLFWAFGELFVTQRHKSWRMGLLLGVLSVAQWFVNEEVLLDVFMFAAVGLIALAITHPRAVVAHIKAALPGVLTAAVLFVAVVAYPLWFVLRGPEHLLGPTQPAWLIAGYRLDALGPLFPNIKEVTQVPASVLATHRGAHAIPWAGTAGYLGIPLAIVLFALAGAWWRNRMVRVASFMAAASYFIALGGRLTIDGHHTGIPLPGGVFQHLPLLDEVLPQRIVVIMWLWLAVVLGVGLDCCHSWVVTRRAADASHEAAAAPGREPKMALLLRRQPVVTLVVLVGLVLATSVPILASAPLRRTAAVMYAKAAPMISEHTPSGGVVMLLPPIRSTADMPMLWQAASDMEYRTVGGYVIVPDDSYSSQQSVPPTLALSEVYAVLPFSDGHIKKSVATRSQMRAACRALPLAMHQYDVRSVVIWALPGEAIARIIQVVTARLGPAPLREGGLLMWSHAISRVRDKSVCSSLT
jgi:hypothetical protein